MCNPASVTNDCLGAFGGRHETEIACQTAAREWKRDERYSYQKGFQCLQIPEVQRMRRQLPDNRGRTDLTLFCDDLCAGRP